MGVRAHWLYARVYAWAYRMMRSRVCCGAKEAMEASGVLESLSVSRVSCVCTSTLRPTLLSGIGAELQREM